MIQARMLAVLLLCGCNFGLSEAWAQAAVPIEQEPAHRLALQNERVRVFHVQLPPGAVSQWHEHRFDGVSVRIGDAAIRDEPMGGAAEDVNLRRGAVSFGATPVAFKHRVRNIGVTPFDNVYIELLDGPGGEQVARSKEQRPAEFENDRIRVLRRVLAPGESTGMHTHAADTVAVMVTSARLQVTQANGTERTLEPAAGAVQWVAAGTTHALRNAGTAAIEIVDVELN